MSNPKTLEIRLPHIYQTSSSLSQLGPAGSFELPGAPQGWLLSSSPGALCVPMFCHVFLFPALCDSSDDLKIIFKRPGTFSICCGWLSNPTMMRRNTLKVHFLQMPTWLTPSLCCFQWWNEILTMPRTSKDWINSFWSDFLRLSNLQPSRLWQNGGQNLPSLIQNMLLLVWEVDPADQYCLLPKKTLTLLYLVFWNVWK